MSEYTNVTAAIEIDDATGLSPAVAIGELKPLALVMPALWTAAVVTMQSSLDGVTYHDVYIKATEYSLTVGVSRHVLLDPSELEGVGPYIKLRSGTSASPVTQVNAGEEEETERVLTLVFRKVG